MGYAIFASNAFSPISVYGFATETWSIASTYSVASTGSCPNLWCHQEHALTYIFLFIYILLWAPNRLSFSHPSQHCYFPGVNRIWTWYPIYCAWICLWRFFISNHCYSLCLFPWFSSLLCCYNLCRASCCLCRVNSISTWRIYAGDPKLAIDGMLRAFPPITGH